MPATLRELERLAVATGFEVAGLEKVVYLLEVLRALTTHPDLDGKLVLKGGTALNLCHQSPRRLSVDLDFNYIGAVKRSEMLEERPVIERAVEVIGRQAGFNVQRSRRAHAGGKFYLSYRSVAGNMDRIEVDLNFLQRIPLLDPASKSLWQPDGQPGPSVPVVSDAELAAGKLSALFDRTAARDLWDVAHLPELLDPWPPLLLRPTFVAMAGALPHSLDSYKPDEVLAVADSDIRRLLGPTLRVDEPPQAGELARLARPVVDLLFPLTEEEREFGRRLQKGELLPELIFPDQREIAARVQRHPMLLWKVENARRHLGLE